MPNLIGRDEPERNGSSRPTFKRIAISVALSVIKI
jgi:hypothetical protein